MPDSLPINLPSNPNISQNPNVVAAQNQLNQAASGMQAAGQLYNTLNSNAAMIPTLVHDAIQQKYNYNQDLINQTANAFNNFLNVGAADPNAQGATNTNGTGVNIANPYAVAAAQKANFDNAYSNYSQLQNLMNQRMGNIQQLEQTGQNQFNSQVASAQGAYNNAQDMYKIGQQNYQNAYNAAQDAFNRAMQQSQLASQYDTSMAMANAYRNMYSGAGAAQPTNPSATALTYISDLFGAPPTTNPTAQQLYNYQNQLYKNGMAVKNWNQIGVDPSAYWAAWQAANARYQAAVNQKAPMSNGVSRSGSSARPLPVSQTSYPVISPVGAWFSNLGAIGNAL